MKKSKFDPIIMAMGCTEKLMPDPTYVVSDRDVLSKINSLQDIHGRDAEGRTLLMYGVLYERSTVVEYLIGNKVDVHAKDKNQYTALHFAAQVGNVNIIRLLVDAGADVNAKDRYGNGPLMRCSNDTPISALELLLKSGANPLQKNDYGMSATDVFVMQDDVIKLFKRFIYEE